jgi:hypothetical protein
MFYNLRICEGALLELIFLESVIFRHVFLGFQDMFYL